MSAEKAVSITEWLIRDPKPFREDRWGVAQMLVTFTAASTFGITRYRASSEVALCILAGLGVAWVTSRRADTADEPGDDPAAEPVPA